MEKYAHIIKHEKTLNDYEVKCRDLTNLLAFFEQNQDEFYQLIDYYQSEERTQDLIDDEQQKIPIEIHRGVLSEDAIYNLYGEYRELSLRMLEIGTAFFKNT